MVRRWLLAASLVTTALLLHPYRSAAAPEDEPIDSIDPGPGGSCSVSCSSGYYACCHSAALCHCHDNARTEWNTCAAGGIGSSSCSIGSRVASEPALDQFLATLAENPNSLDARQRGALNRLLPR